MKSTLIIAEAGVNHNGNIEIAKKLIDVAKKAGVDYVKFQTFKAKEITTKAASRAEYQNKNIKSKGSQFEMLKKLEINESDHRILINYCKKKKINFLSTAFDLNSLDLLHKMGLKLAKIPSGEITNYPYLKKVAQLFPKVILSTGMSTLSEVIDAINVLQKFGLKKDNIILLHCNTQYPTPMSDVNLKAMLHMKRELDIQIGYSDHTLGIEVAIAAVSLGATVIEKHFTLDRNQLGPDHKASLEPMELKSLVNSIRNVDKAISGSELKEPTNSEINNRIPIRKSIVAINTIKKGEFFTKKNIGVKRPGNGISPMNWEKILGQISKHNFKKDELIKL